MTREEAKQLLELCRPGSPEDLQDPALSDAVALLETDAELKAWFEAQQSVDAKISESLQSIPVPADLHASILAGMRLHQTHAKESANDDTIAFPQEPSKKEAQAPAWWLSPWTGIAALFLIAMVIFTLPEGKSTQTAALNAGAPPVIQFLATQLDSFKSWQFDKRDERPDHLRAYLASSHAPAPNSIPGCLEKMPSIGCVTFDYGDTKLSMICFKNGEVYHLITADKANYPDALPAKPETFQIKDKAYRLWVDGEQVKILTIKGTKEDMPEFI